MWPRPTRRRGWPQAGLLGQAAKCLVDIGWEQSGAVGGDQQRGAGRSGQQPIALMEVPGQSIEDGWVQRQHPDLAVLPPDRQGVAVLVEAGDVQGDGLPGADPGGGHQPDQGAERCGPQLGPQQTSSLQQGMDLLSGVNVGRDPGWSGREESGRWHLDVGVLASGPPGETSDG